jgi:hypothetical protein
VHYADHAAGAVKQRDALGVQQFDYVPLHWVADLRVDASMNQAQLGAAVIRFHGSPAHRVLGADRGGHADDDRA